ncbi:selenocysteine-specific translation elongation factor [Bacillaceae bacterium S4-13-56]
MEKRYFTIGMAGHIDHGKTTLTKALTQIDTDRLKEEKERKISIELGFAPLQLEDENLLVSIIDVPGHERFIRQMIAGVAGIDLVLLVIAADEGVMPQTKEHLDILTLLGITNGIIVVTKTSMVEDELLELVEEDIREQVNGSAFEDSPMLFVDSISEKGINELKTEIELMLKELPPRDQKGSFRLPIDQVFTVQGQGTVVRGTIYEGSVNKEDRLMILPYNKPARIRQIQVHKKPVEQAFAGQRAAINLGGISKNEIYRGDVLVCSDHFVVTDTVDISLTLVDSLDIPLKQRSPVKFHTGTSEVMGKIVFFDRNEVTQDDKEVLCQIRLEEEIVTRRGDRFILRRPSPVETMGGGWIIDPKGEKYRFGEKTIEQLERKKEGTPEEHLLDLLSEHAWLTETQLIQELALDPDDVRSMINNLRDKGDIQQIGNHYVRTRVMNTLQDQLLVLLNDYHDKFPLRVGMNKPEAVKLITAPKPLVEQLITKWMEAGLIKSIGPYLSEKGYTPTYPKGWGTRLEKLEQDLLQDGLEVQEWETYVDKYKVPAEVADEFWQYLSTYKNAFVMSDKHLIHRDSLEKAIHKLNENTGDLFSLKEAKDILGLSRKYLIPFMEKLDQEGYTTRVEDNRKWRKKL